MVPLNGKFGYISPKLQRKIHILYKKNSETWSSFYFVESLLAFESADSSAFLTKTCLLRSDIKLNTVKKK